MDTIISKSNEKVKFIKSLNEKKFRQKHRCFYLEGIKVVKEILNQEKAMDIMFIAFSKDLLLQHNGGEEVFEILQTYGKEHSVELLAMDEKVFSSITDTVTPQGVLAVMRIPEYDLDDLIIQNQNNNILILDKIQDAGNIGTIIRSADAFNVPLIFCIMGTTDIYAPKVIRSTMGSIAKTTVVYISEEDIGILLYKLKENGYTISGTSPMADMYIEDLTFDTKYVFIMGNEANGISQKIESLCDNLIKIPMSKRTESLNVGVAAGILLYEQYKHKQ